MNRLSVVLLLLWMLVVRSALGGEITTNNAASFRFAPFTLPDQFKQERSISFSNAPLRLLTVADQKGSDPMTNWVAGIKARFGTNLPMVAVADVSSVPGLLRGMIRRKFVERYRHPVLLDFTGDVIRPWKARAGEPNLFLAAPDGRLLGCFHGEATKTNLAPLLLLIEQHGVKPQP
jgi:hypothetical protein